MRLSPSFPPSLSRRRRSAVEESDAEAQEAAEGDDKPQDEAPLLPSQLMRVFWEPLPDSDEERERIAEVRERAS